MIGFGKLNVVIKPYWLYTELVCVGERSGVQVVQLLLRMPSYKVYENVFGSWIKSLILSGVLECGVKAQTRGYQCVAIDGHVCHSLAEKVIDDWLSAHKISHIKEPLYPYDYILNPSGKMRGDWQVQDFILEYAGLLDDPEYYAKIEAKKQLANKFNIPLFVIEPADLFSLDEILGGILQG